MNKIPTETNFYWLSILNNSLHNIFCPDSIYELLAIGFDKDKDLLFEVILATGDQVKITYNPVTDHITFPDY